MKVEEPKPLHLGAPMEVLLPHATDLAAMVRRAGIEEVASAFRCSSDTIKRRLYDAGFTRGGHEDSGEFIFPELGPEAVGGGCRVRVDGPRGVLPRQGWL